MARCTGAVVVSESPTVPTFTLESDGQTDTSVLEGGALTIHVDPSEAQDICTCGEEIIAITTVLYDGEFTYDADAIYSATLAS